jgi:hypothetical protein
MNYVTHSIPFFFFSYICIATLYLCTLDTYLRGYLLQHLANMSILALSSGQTEPFASSLLYHILLVCLGPTRSLLFVPTIHISHVHPPFTTRRLNTAIQVNNMGAQHFMYNGHISGPETPEIYFLKKNCEREKEQKESYVHNISTYLIFVRELVRSRSSYVLSFLGLFLYYFEVKKGLRVYFSKPKKPLPLFCVWKKKKKNRPAVGTGTNQRQVKKK